MQSDIPLHTDFKQSHRKLLKNQLQINQFSPYILVIHHL
uniref:Uncharacterized protein n=1 Tax=Anguilla anguilla TaxID=7936 RepID=A0A0E9QA24_ANGAN